ncbi:MAG: ribonuclease D [Rhodospirillaceae bacterium]|nr:ribonuclease D [Rhodospirillaceae bacterium]MCA8931398.1 ribonuclease D [Rhodospirillaceae bacterium]
MSVITETAALAELCQHLERQDYITVDTEFLRDATFWPRLCLVQLGADDGAWAIDPLAGDMDLAPLWALLVEAPLPKVFHAARQDVEIIVRATGRVPEPLFDTQIAAMVCGFGDQVGYERLVSELAKKRLDKSSRFTDWSRRPLTEKQIRYALDDVIYLRPVYEALRDQLAANNRSGWMQEELSTLTDPATYLAEPEDAWRRIRTRSTDPRFLAVLREVATWRETEARGRDVPRTRLLRDEAMLEIAAQAPKTLEALDRLRGVPKGLAGGRVGKAVVDAVNRALALDPGERPKVESRPVVTANTGPTVELLRVLLKMCCEDAGVAQRLVASGDDLERLAADDDADIPALHGWRREVFGHQALDLKHGHTALALKNGQVVVVDAAGGS